VSAGPDPQGDLLIATFSGRSLAASAQAAGYRPLVADLFADNDLRDLVADFRTVEGDFVSGFDGDELLTALESLSIGRDPVGVVCGPGFEDRPELLDEIARRWRLIGNTGATVRRLKDPLGFAALCRELGIRHPETQIERPTHDEEAWLSKRAGAAGGLHIGSLAERPPSPDRYYQRIVEGDRRSALFVASGGKAEILGLSEQWPNPGPTEPYRYGGACGPVTVAGPHDAGMRRAVEAIAAALPDLVGLGSADFLLPAGEAPVLLEINPRSGASMDVFERPGHPLLRLHIEACEGRLPGAEGALPKEPVRAAGFAYLDVETVTIGAVDWPDFVSDRPMPGTVIRFGEPLCTLKADGPDADTAIALFAARLSAMKSMIEGSFE
jgi:predicted ATP-grasp superfamily ATP-dependent carboligase